MVRKLLLAAAGFLVLPAAVALAAATPEQKCEASKHKVTGGYQQCLHKAVAKSLKTGDALDVTKCESKFSGQWNKAESTGACIDLVPDPANIVPTLNEQVGDTTAMIAGATIPYCGDGAVNRIGELCDGAALDGEDCTTLGFSSGTLACHPSLCLFDAAGCVP